MKYISDSEVESGDEEGGLQSGFLGMDNELLKKFIKYINGSTDNIKTLINTFYK